MGVLDNYNFELLVNEAERLVLAELERQITGYDGELCLCNDCVVDMAAAALNSVQPLYHHSLLGALWTAAAMDDPDYAQKVRGAVEAAIEKVRKNPGHDDDKDDQDE
jgi:competence protein ComFB